MDDREISIAAVAAGAAFVLAAALGAGPVDWTLDLAMAPLGLELSATFAGVTIQFSF